ncbi:efflux RND transporter periplasmic adaptor subunit [Dethiobacter alkaliphilus]|uniref:Efflux transporter, RND family, MFP subunit n=1 Tax=Dethiobacter alkaliphilus AHT 1 TaxID=555088 RepID=C0GKV1_DETAL|nr:efflux RND transporter periplasmic adaptor subunit [Dethiobacter alkaliphilus]EEG76033.1 efflux transporter, RND family, MFP subunit [Dethiobacter alkaliphilus AHT 1]
MKKKTIYVLAGILTLVILVFALSQSTETDAQSAEEIRTASAQKRVFGSSMLAVGTLKPELGAMVQIDTPGAGVVEEVLVEQGAAVKAGDTLAVITIDGAQQRIKKAELALQMAKLQLEQVTSGPREEEVARARINLEQAENKLKEAEETLSVLKDDEETPSGQLDNAQREVDNADAQYRLAQQQYSLTKNKYTQNDIAQAEARVEQAANDLQEARALAEQGTITAPIDGVVAELHIYPGAVVSGNSNLIKLIDLNRLIVEALIDETDIIAIEKGQQAAITLDSLDTETLEGTVGSISPLAKNESGIINYPVIISLEHVAAGFYPDMTAVVTIYLEEPQETLTVPSQAISQSGSKQMVYVLQDDEIYETEVQTGKRSDGYVEIVSGLKAGEKVVINTADENRP